MMTTTSSGKAGVAADAVRKRIRTLPGRFLTESADGLAVEWELRIGDEEFTATRAIVERPSPSDGGGPLR